MADEGVANIAGVEAAIQVVGAGWTPRPTSMTALDPGVRRLRLGAVPPPGVASMEARARAAGQRAVSASAADVPNAVDLRSFAGANYVTPVKDQANCGSCVAFGSLAAVESTVRVVSARPDAAVDLSEAHLFYCHGAADGRRCNTGWWVDPALDACRDKGVVVETEFPYTPGDRSCQIPGDSPAVRFHILGYKNLGQPEEMKSWLATQGALVACFSVYEDFYTYSSGVYRHVTGGLEGGHCVCIVGYSDAEGCWIAKNSWGTDWGEDGFFKIAYRDCGIDFEMWGVEVPSGDTDDTTSLEDRRITGVWFHAGTGEAAALVDGMGWKPLAEAPALLQLAGIARATGARVDLGLVADVVTEIYVL